MNFLRERDFHMRKPILGLVFLALLGCSQREKAPIGIISAIPEELKLMRDSLVTVDEVKVGPWQFWEGTWKGKRVVLTVGGVGKVNAAVVTNLLVDHFHPRAIIFSGIAGGVPDSAQIGDITISSQAVEHDFGAIVPVGGVEGRAYPGNSDLTRGFVPSPVPVMKGSTMVGITYFRADSLLIELAKRASEEVKLPPIPQLNRIPQVRVGVVATGDQFIASSQKCRWLYQSFHALSTEMEGGAVAQVATTYGVPWVLIRCNSDRADEEAHQVIKEFGTYAARNSASIVLKLIELFPDGDKALKN